MWVMGKSGRYFAHRGRYFAAQQPRTMRCGHDRVGLGDVDWMVWAMSRIMVSASLSSYWEVRRGMPLKGQGGSL